MALARSGRNERVRSVIDDCEILQVIGVLE
jgi:hypothetical protein